MKSIGALTAALLAACIASGFGKLVSLRSVDPALVREEQDPVMRGADEQVLDNIVLAKCGSLDTLATTALRAIQV